MRRSVGAVLLGVLIGTVSSLTAAQTLSEQVLQLLVRDNTWTGQQTFANTKGVLLQRGTLAPAPATDRLYNISGNLYFNGALVVPSVGVGTVTSVGLSAPNIFSVTGSPVTTTGTLTLSLAQQTRNFIWAGPAAGSPATPTFRAIVDNDVPDDITINGINNVTWESVDKTHSSLADLGVRSASDINTGTLPSGRFPATLPSVSGVNLTFLNATELRSGTVAAGRMPAFTGDATAIAGTANLTLASTAVTPATYGDATHVASFTVDAKGRLTFAGDVAISLSGITIPSLIQGDTLYASAADTLAPLTKSTTATQYLANTGTDNNPKWDYINLANGVTGTLPAANGGTSVTSTPTNGQLLIGNGSGYTLATLTGTADQIFVTNGAGTITLSTPQGIATTSTPQFARLGLGTGAGANATLTTNGQFDLGFVDDGNCGASDTINWNTGEIHQSTLTAATCTLTFSNPIAGRTYVYHVAQDGTGSRLVTWPGTVLWPGGTPPTLSTGANKIDVCTFLWNGTNYLGNCTLNY